MAPELGGCPLTVPDPDPAAKADPVCPLADRRTPPEWVEDLAARFTALGIDPEPPPR